MPTNCVQLFENRCLYCNPGYFIGPTGNCDPCPKGCLSCNSTSYCGDCDKGYFYSLGWCHKCKEECSECTSNTTCVSCVTPYMLHQQTCVAKCPRGYFNDTDIPPIICKSCGADGKCAECVNNKTCTLCQDRFKLVGNYCEECPTGCLKCNENYCEKCATGKYYDGSSCRNCKVSQCTKCDATHCFECPHGYYPTSSQCEECLGVDNCQICETNYTCSQCNDGYYLNNKLCDRIFLDYAK